MRTRIGWRRAAGALFLLAQVLAVGVAAPPGASAATFDKNTVVSDTNFLYADSLSEAGIQAFLGTETGILKSLVTTDHAGVNKPASRIIFEAAQAHGVSPKVIISTLQKEQSLIALPSPSPTALSLAMGYHTSNPATRGFGKQVWYGASGLANPYFPWPGPGTEREVLDGIVTPTNRSTWSLYSYTPWIGLPVVWKDQYYDVGGNELFWRVYERYFDDPLVDPALVPVYRFYKLKQGVHFYTASELERFEVKSNLSSVYRYEGIAYRVDSVDPDNIVPLYRFYSPKRGVHFYTASESEKNSVVAKLSAVYTYEGVAYRVSLAPNSGIPVYRFYNARRGAHFYTTSETEKASVIANLSAIYRYEGVAYYIGN